LKSGDDPLHLTSCDRTSAPDGKVFWESHPNYVLNSLMWLLQPSVGCNDPGLVMDGWMPKEGHRCKDKRDQTSNITGKKIRTDCYEHKDLLIEGVETVDEGQGDWSTGLTAS
jgi:hypothetical protein